MKRLLPALAALAAVAGCGRNPAAPNADRTIAVTRNVGSRIGFRRHFEAWKGAFEKANPGWKMELIDLGDGHGSEYYKSRIATGDLPDIVMTWLMTPWLADGGHLLELPPSFYEALRVPPPPPYKGKFYVVQMASQLQGIAVNKRMWAGVGITEPPATWDAFLAGLEKLKAKGYRPLVYGGREWSANMPLFLSIMANMYHDPPAPGKPSWTRRRDAGKVRYATDPTARLIIEKMIHLLENFAGKGAASDGYSEEQRAFYGGQGAAWFMGCWIGGDVEAHRLDLDLDYWPIPSMTGRTPVFLDSGELQAGWAATAGTTGEKRDKAVAALSLFYEPHVFQLFLDGECQFNRRFPRLAPKGPRSAWPPAQRLFDAMQANAEKYGTTPGVFSSFEDLPPEGGDRSGTAVMQEILAGTRDVDRLLQMLDDDWDMGRKGRKK